MRELMAARYPIYATADITVESRDVPHDDDRRRDHRGAGASALLADAQHADVALQRRRAPSRSSAGEHCAARDPALGIARGRSARAPTTC